MIVGGIDRGLLLVVWSTVESVGLEVVDGVEAILGGGTEIGGVLS